MRRCFSYDGLRGALRRAVVLALVVAAALVAGRFGLWPAAGLLALAVAAYALSFPRHVAPLHYAAGPAVIGPDWLGILWSALFFAMPLWAGVGERGLHPSAWLLWPMAAAGLIFLAIGWWSESFGLTPGAEGIELRRGFARIELPWGAIAAVQPWSRDLPRWMRALAPLLAAAHPTAAGAIMLARPRRGLALELEGHRRLVIETDALRPGPEALLQVLARREEIG